MKNILFLSVLVFLGISYQGNAQEKFTISGYIEDATNAEKLIGASVYVVGESKGTNTNLYGFYSLTLPKDSVYLGISYVGYESQYYKLYLDKDISLNFQIKLAELEVVEVSAERLDRIEDNTQMSQVSVPIQQIKKLPALLGEVDVLKTLQLLPGVQSGGEGTSGLYVRGGSPDQNLILLDGTPVYNVSHLFGFFSVFNADAINKVQLTKGGYPARFGGRLSSVLEINMKEGDMKKVKVQGTIGLLAAKLTVEGPIVKDKTSFILSGRRTYVDLLAKPFIKAQNTEEEKFGGGYNFYDINAKINHKFSDKDRLYASLYTGKDKFFADIESNRTNSRNESRFGLDWGNVTSALRYNHMWSNQLFSNVTATYSRYQFNTRINLTEEDTFNGVTESVNFGARYISGIEDFAAKIDFDFLPNPSHYIKFGVSGTHHTFKPGAIQFKYEEDVPVIDTTLGSSNVQSGDYAVYIEDDIKIGKIFKTNIGVHASAFVVDGKTYGSVQPRIGFRLMLPGDYALKGSFATMTQYLHLLTNEGIGLPTDLWLPSTARIKPENSWQAALGIAKTFDNKFEVSIEGYYKQMNNLLSYKEGANFFGFTDWQDKVEVGKGDSYGVELFFQKKFGKTTGWAGYTLSWSNRQFDNINGGVEYPFKYDRRHDISLVFLHEFSEKVQMSATWVYGTGNAITLPISKSVLFYPNEYDSPDFTTNQGVYVETSQEKNSYRMQSYHRLDVGIDFIKKKKRYERKFTIGFYNAYNRKNPFFIYADEDDNGDPKFKQFSLFPVLPSFAYSFKF